MNEDLTAIIRVGITVTIVALLIGTVLNLIVIAQSILAGGRATAQSGVDQIGIQEFERYNQKKVSGIDVMSALSLYEGRDIGILVSTKQFDPSESDSSIKAANYGSRFSNSAITEYEGGAKTAVVTITKDASGKKPARLSSGEVKDVGNKCYSSYYSQNGEIQTNMNREGVSKVGDPQCVRDSARFRAKLIYSLDGAIIGIYFREL